MCHSDWTLSSFISYFLWQVQSSDTRKCKRFRVSASLLFLLICVSKIVNQQVPIISSSFYLVHNLETQKKEEIRRWVLFTNYWRLSWRTSYQLAPSNREQGMVTTRRSLRSYRLRRVIAGDRVKVRCARMLTVNPRSVTTQSLWTPNKFLFKDIVVKGVHWLWWQCNAEQFLNSLYSFFGFPRPAKKRKELCMIWACNP